MEVGEKDGSARYKEQGQGQACVGLGSGERNKEVGLKRAGGVWQLRPGWCEFCRRCGEGGLS